jgi:hypothetical protein
MNGPGVAKPMVSNQSPGLAKATPLLGSADPGLGLADALEERE